MVRTGWPIVLAGWLLAGSSGCVTTFSLLKSEPPPVPVCQIVATWGPQVEMVPDPTQGGKPTPGLAGRVYLFGRELGHPITGDGHLVVKLYDHTSRGSGPSAPVLLEVWKFDPDALKKLLKVDRIGQGYTIFLPWGTYRPDIARVHMDVVYEGGSGTPIYVTGAPMTLDHGSHGGVVPASVKVPVQVPLAAMNTAGRSAVASTPQAAITSLPLPAGQAPEPDAPK